VHIGNFTNTTYNYPGLLARGFSTGGAPLDGTNGECYVSWLGLMNSASALAPK